MRTIVPAAAVETTELPMARVVFFGRMLVAEIGIW
jgi:hypothetical protein